MYYIIFIYIYIYIYYLYLNLYIYIYCLYLYLYIYVYYIIYILFIFISWHYVILYISNNFVSNTPIHISRKTKNQNKNCDFLQSFTTIWDMAMNYLKIMNIISI